ncbi:corrinoid ABC transporter substrate-binding protein [Variibacter gotjawalensis]|uniref:Corrinoid ABC transporter substrate-binding protein n=1 Tax=Variibacter gotjawalensis TaxID=1333996 RepID=A0A0S3PSS1_9BRAD|nr:ABC transporter substrate-binding protein [Variibacter gotjawalensis]NIK49283.1 iron complex transport system substrate-binding protein [Variibacter gotjawalensis]RZS51134.1 iron complex transport system substrate-binding protein [Variibacter gotjawalensis]BAT58969.1 corrinoid ABC transporter substrate-binding protein [Variibacter gotjawalensis]
MRAVATTLLGVALLSAAPLSLDAAPQRVVSLNICSDELVLRLAEPEHIASVTWLSRDARSSNVSDLAARVPVNHGLAEEVVPQRPDLVFAGAFTTTTATALIRRQGIPVRILPIAASVDDARAHIREVASALGTQDRGEAIVADMDRRLAALPAAPPRAVSALVLNPAGFAVGADSLIDDIMRRAGLENTARRLGAQNFIPLELVVMSAPELLIINAARDGPPSLATEILKHPALARMKNTRTIVLPSRLWTCGGPGNVEAIERLIAVAREVRS